MSFWVACPCHGPWQDILYSVQFTTNSRRTDGIVSVVALLTSTMALSLLNRRLQWRYGSVYYTIGIVSAWIHPSSSGCFEHRFSFNQIPLMCPKGFEGLSKMLRYWDGFQDNTVPKEMQMLCRISRRHSKWNICHLNTTIFKNLDDKVFVWKCREDFQIL